MTKVEQIFVRNGYEKAIYACFDFFMIEEEEPVNGDFILENGDIIGDNSHTGEGMLQGIVDIERTNDLMKEMVQLPFDEWEFNLLIKSDWNGNNWKILIHEIGDSNG